LDLIFIITGPRHCTKQGEANGTAFTEILLFLASTWFFSCKFIKAIIDTVQGHGKGPLKGKGLNKRDELPQDLPSIVEIKKVLPNRCFQPRVLASMVYVFRDVFLIAVTFASIYYLHQFQNPIIWWSSLLIYWGVQGTFFTAVFVVGHDCGHDSFSNYKIVNDIVGQIMHAFLFCPFYMWKLSHRHHHKFSNNFDKDEVFYPVKKTDSKAQGKILPGFGFGLGWYGYLMLGYQPRPVNHFNPLHPMFVGHLFGCLCSVGALGVMSWLLYKFYLVFGFWGLFNYYVVPDFIFASFCVLITFLHHTEEHIPWYADDQWDFVRGQLSTIDRNYGFVHYIIHSIGTHQMHHMFTKIPHYHLEEATYHFRKNFPSLVRICDEPIISSFFRMFSKYEKQCKMNEGTKVHFYR
jgi:omega-3 fatty acid desaturase (delta-15 desaturase)